MGIRKSSQTRSTIRLPLRLDKIAKDLCHCKCHTAEAPKDNPHRHKQCACIPTYGLDGHARSVVQ